MTDACTFDRTCTPAPRSARWKLAAGAFALALLPTWSAAQTPSSASTPGIATAPAAPATWAPLGADAVLRAEVSRSVRPAIFSDDHGWSGARPVELRASRSNAGLLVLDGSNGSQFLVFQKSWFQALRLVEAGSNPIHVHDSSRPAGALSTGQKWTARIVFEQAPVDWCNETRIQFEGKFEVGKAESYRLTLNGQPQSMEVLPVVERGTWSRCFSGKRYTRMLYAPALDAVVSIEFITYRTNGQPHEASFRMQVKELVAAQAN